MQYCNLYVAGILTQIYCFCYMRILHTFSFHSPKKTSSVSILCNTLKFNLQAPVLHACKFTPVYKDTPVCKSTYDHLNCVRIAFITKGIFVLK